MAICFSNGRAVCRVARTSVTGQRLASQQVANSVCATRVSTFYGEALLRPGATFLTGAASLRAQQPVRRGRERVTGPVQVHAVSAVWVALAAAVGGLLAGLAIARVAQNLVVQEINPMAMSQENAALRAKVEDLQQLIVKYEPLAYRGMRLRFTKGINKAVILAMVDQLLENKEVNIWWLPDSLERILYFNVICLLLSVMDEVVDGMSINLAGHNVKLQLTYLDMQADQELQQQQQQQQDGMIVPGVA